MSTELAINQAELEQKIVAWGNFGKKAYTTELSINHKAQQLLSGHYLPASIDQIEKAEALLKQLKAGKAEIVTERKVITGKTDELSSRLMTAEKSLDEPIKALEQSIIKLKKEYEAKEAAKRAKEDEYRRIVETLKTAVAGCDANYKSIINNKVDQAYTYALQELDLKPADVQVQEYLRKCRLKITEASFPVPALLNAFNYHTEDELAAIKTELYNIDRGDYVLMYSEKLNEKFSDYAVAYNNKAEALKRAAEEKAAAEAAIKQEVEQKQIAAQIDAAAVNIEETPTLFTKALKKSYEVDMVENTENAIKILAAFTANLDVCLKKVRVTKWFSFTPEQAATALAKVKCDDNNFQPSGITFKEVDKL